MYNVHCAVHKKVIVKQKKYTHNQLFKKLKLKWQAGSLWEKNNLN